MERVKISDNVDFSRIIQGFWRVNSWNMSTGQLTDYIKMCMDRGVDTFDTADIYGLGQCEIEVGRALKGLNRDSYKIVSKGGILPSNTGGASYYDTTYRHITEACELSVKKLNCEYLDLYLIHREDPLICHEEAAGALADLKKRGLIKEFGVSNFDPWKLEALNSYAGGGIRMNQIEWNPCCFEHFESGMFDLLQKLKIHPMIWSPLCGGLLLTSDSEPYARTRSVLAGMAEKYGVSISTVVYAWILKHPVKAMPLCGSGKIQRLDEAVKALDVDIEREDWYKIYAASGQKTIR